MEKVRRSGWGAIVIGLLLLGGGLGYLVIPPTVDQTVTVIDQNASRQLEPVTMPALSGMSEDAARIALQDAGVAGLAVKRITTPAAGVPGTVLAQDPVPGVGVQGFIYLTVSSAVPTPKLAGLEFRDATARVEDLGGVVRLEQVVDPSVEAGTVLSTVPKAGDTMGAVTVLRVASSGQAVALANVSDADSDGCSRSSSPGEVGGTSVATELRCSVYEDDTAYIEYALGGVAQRFTAVVGLDADSGPGQGTVRFLVDGAQVAQVAIGTTARPVSFKLAGKQTLRIVVTGRGADGDSARVLIGDATVYALPEQAAQIGITP